MKRFVKWCLILTGVLLAVGIGLRVAGAIMGGRAESNSYYARRWDDFAGHWDWPMGGLLGETQTKDSGAITDAISAIDVSVDCGDITLRQGECFSVSMAWNLRGFTLDYEIEDGVLKVESDSKSGFLNGVSGWKNEVTITVPTVCALKSLELSTNLGDVDVDADITVTEADLSTALGDVECKGIWAEELTAGTDLGDVDVSLPGTRGDYRWELETSLGELAMNGEKQSGDAPGAKLRGGKGVNYVTAHSNLGDVSVSFVGRDLTDYPHHDEYHY